MDSERSKGILAGFVSAFLKGNLPVILIILSFCFGFAAVVLTPREEEPQIIVPLADVFVNFPGANAEEVERLVTVPLEKLLWQIDGVEYVYSTSRHDTAIVTVRFFVGEDRERSLVKLYNKIESNRDIVPPAVTGWVVKPIEIDDVPIVTLTLHSPFYNDYEVRRIAEELLVRLETVENISKSYIIGGRPREVRVELDPQHLAGRGISPLEVTSVIEAADFALTAGTLTHLDHTFTVKGGPFLETIKEVEGLVVGIHNGKPVYLHDVATIKDVAAEAETYTYFSNGPAVNTSLLKKSPEPAVTLAIAKKKGTNAVKVADDILKAVKTLKETFIPDNLEITVTRNYGETANQKVNDLLISLVFAIIAVVSLLAYTLGWREGVVVAVAVPITFSLSLFVNFLAGYTINRVTLFALILSLGLVVDDPITNVDNIKRHISLGKRSSLESTLYGVMEVMPPVIMSTLTIIVSFMPMFFITGMMGPYMEPMAINVPLAVSFSTLVSLTVTPWASYKLLKDRQGQSEKEAKSALKRSGRLRKLYRYIIEPFLGSRFKSIMILAIVAMLMILSLTLVIFRKVPLKILPFDNKNELQVVLDMPEGTTLERMNGAVKLFEEYLSTVSEVKDFQSYIGTSAPIDFNGMVRHYYLRRSPNLADIRVNLVDKKRRKQQSHAIALRIRKDLQAIADRVGANLKIVEVPPGPPVISTLVAEITGGPETDYDSLISGARLVSKEISAESGVLDIDTSAEDLHNRISYVLDKEKAALHGISTRDVALSLRLAIEGLKPGFIHLENERQPLTVKVCFPLLERSNTAELSRLAIKGKDGALVEMAEIGEFVELAEEQPIYHKNLERVVYVFAEVVGRSPGEAVLDLKSRLSNLDLPHGISVNWAGEGELKITIDVFRDLGFAFGGALILIYILLIIQTGSFLMPVVIMQSIPLTVIGILPGFFLLNLFATKEVGGYANPLFFTATGMIGMIALGGIVVRNSIVLIEFITEEIRQGRTLNEAIIESGVIRLRPILLTAATTMLGVLPITLDPVFSGLAWSLIFGIVASTLFTLIIVPVIYNLIYGRQHAV